MDGEAWFGRGTFNESQTVSLLEDKRGNTAWEYFRVPTFDIPYAANNMPQITPFEERLALIVQYFNNLESPILISWKVVVLEIFYHHVNPSIQYAMQFRGASSGVHSFYVSTGSRGHSDSSTTYLLQTRTV